MPNTPPVLFVAGTGQHSGKTLVSLGLVMAARASGRDVRYMKPVGQRTVKMGDKRVDEDVALLIEVCGLPIKPESASPVTLPSGFTRRFLTEDGDSSELETRIRNAFEDVSEGADVVVVEGTGHAGVGSVVGLSNARVAHLLGAEVIMVTGGGIGRPIDEFCLNQALFAREGVRIFGMAANKVIPDKVREVGDLLRKWAQRQGVCLLGLIPYEPLLAEITVAQVAHETGADIVAGEDNLNCLIETVIVGAEPAHRFLDCLAPGVLALIPGDRDDLVLAAVSAQQADTQSSRRGPAAICLTSGILPHPSVMAIVSNTSLPVIAVEEGMFAAASMISDLVAKMTSSDRDKIERSHELVTQHLDLDTLWDRLGC